MIRRAPIAVPEKASDMAMHSTFGLNEALEPDPTRILVSAFEIALQSLDAFDSEHLDPYATRQRLAKCIVELALAGERDVTCLRERALAHLRGCG